MAGSDSLAGSQSSEPRVPDQHSVGTSEVLQPADTRITASAMAERVNKMFIIGAKGPARSGQQPAVRKPTKELVQVGFKAINDRCDKDGKELSASFGNFDRVVGLGWLLGNAVGLPLMPHMTAHAVGLKARRIAGNVKADLAAAERATKKVLAKLDIDDSKRSEVAATAEKAKATLLLTPVDLPLPSAAHCAPAKATGKRKRKRVQGEETLEGRIAAAEHARVQHLRGSYRVLVRDSRL